MSPTRRYSTSLRDEHTAVSRRRILTAAESLFTEVGYRGTTLAAVAATAEVSVQTVYNVVGGKPALLKKVYDTRLAGDDDPVPIAQRAIAQAVAEAPDARTCLARYAEMSRALGERALPLVTRLLAQAASGDPDLNEFATTIEAERAAGSGRVAQHVADRFGLRAGLDTATAADVVWALTAPELADRLVRQRGWSWDRFQGWLGRALADMLVGPATDPGEAD